MSRTPPSFHTPRTAPLYFPYDVLFEARRDTFPINRPTPDPGSKEWMTLISRPSFLNLQKYEAEENRARDAVPDIMNALYETEGPDLVEDIARALEHAVSIPCSPFLSPQSI